MGDFNTNLLNYGDNYEVTEFLDTMISNFFLPQIIQPTRITKTSQTLIDNIFLSNPSENKSISGNITSHISDHLPQFLILTNILHEENNLKRDKTTIRDFKINLVPKYKISTGMT